MLKRMMCLSVLAVAVGITFPSAAVASRTILGRITGYSPTSLSVSDREIVTVTLDSPTVYTKLITQKPWEEDTRLDAGALRVGRYVAVHIRKEAGDVADWVQIATDVRTTEPAAGPTRNLRTVAPLPMAQARRTREDDGRSPEALEALRRGRGEVRGRGAPLVGQGDRSSPNASETKRPGGPDTAAHCDRLAQSNRDAAIAARALARDHEQMAAAAK